MNGHQPKPPVNALWSTDRQRPDGKSLPVRLRGGGTDGFNTKARRSVVIQCERCLDKGTGTLNRNGRLVSVNLASEPRTSRGATISHLGCGGTFRLYDIPHRA